MRFKKSPQLPGAGRTRSWYHHGSHTATSPVKWPVNPNILAPSVSCGIDVTFNLRSYSPIKLDLVNLNDLNDPDDLNALQ